ncbi:hypothetical protein C4B24_01865 [Mycoplasma marinum]|uniref:Uncharacterized protein n=1 Tax=Mycoplasma marinum TaxID=1937190 RepID=A0A4R0XLF0_9MOLU|nr:hypothetical protein C4B24_01865 [Mycoplasma marinum]
MIAFAFVNFLFFIPLKSKNPQINIKDTINIERITLELITKALIEFILINKTNKDTIKTETICFLSHKNIVNIGNVNIVKIISESM